MDTIRHENKAEILEEMVDSRAAAGKYKLSWEHLVTPKSKKGLKEWGRHDPSGAPDSQRTGTPIDQILDNENIEINNDANGF